MNFIKKYFIQRQNKAKLRDTVTDKPFPKKVASIGILAENLDDVEIIKEQVKNIFGKQIEIYSLFYSKSEVENGISEKDFSLFGKPNDKINGFLSKNLDFILTPSLNLDPYLLYLLLHASAKFKIGFFSPENKDLLDLMLSKDDKNIEANSQKLLEYFIKIKAAC
ncbi:hypothetical protein SAMN06295967_104120 [Belliella buryatensis]|uniref:Uncharacterized protein n=1 Tax=Belliella buryatensis TaxID=1500549 RepID=A0A239C8Q1_9BACT|nr:hypothetical protein [Belliella buryatensis]SNS16001.1 hypothetical protein SAMN06295967_104120 [Belliella buryatensis]